MAKVRLIYMDLAKFFAIVCVCTGHVYAMSSLGGGSSPVNRVIASFHMPLFMLLCGFFSTSSMALDVVSFLKKKAVTLLLPAASFTLLSCAFYTCIGVSDLKGRYISEAIGGMWFLRTVFFCYVIVYATKRTRLPDYACCLLSCVLMMVVPHGWYLQTNYLLLFFWTGYFLKKHWGGYYCHRGILTAVSAVFYLLWGRVGSISVITPAVLLSDMALLPMQYLTGLSASLVVIGVAHYLSAFFHLDGENLLAAIGRYTLGIYGVQTILLERIAHSLVYIEVPDGWTNVYDFIVIPAAGGLFCLLSYYVVRLTAKNRTLNLFLFGSMYK